MLGLQRKRKAEPAKTVMRTDDDLMQIAEAEFSLKGIEATKLSVIASAAGVGRSYIYERFRSKIGLYSSLRHQLEPAFYDALASLPYDDLPFEQAVRAYLDVQWEWHARQPILATMMRDQYVHGIAMFDRAAVVTDKLRGLRDLLSRLMERGRVEGLVDPALNGHHFLFLTSFLVMGGLARTIGAGLVEPDFSAQDEFRRLLPDLVLRGIADRQVPPRGMRIAAPADQAAPRSARIIESILDAAEARFAARGFENTVVSEIAATAGVSLQLVYYYYRGKPDLYQAVLDRSVRRSLGDFLNIDLAEPDTRRIIRSFLDTWWDAYDDRPGLARLAVDQNMHDITVSLGRQLAGGWGRLMKEMNGVFERGRAAGVMVPGSDYATFCRIGLSIIPFAVATSASTEEGEGDVVYQELSFDRETAIRFCLRSLLA